MPQAFSVIRTPWPNAPTLFTPGARQHRAGSRLANLGRDSPLPSPADRLSIARAGGILLPSVEQSASGGALVVLVLVISEPFGHPGGLRSARSITST